MTDIETRVAVLEERVEQVTRRQDQDIDEIKVSMKEIVVRLDALTKIADRGMGALWVVLKWGGIVGVIVTSAVYIGGKLRGHLP